MAALTEGLLVAAVKNPNGELTPNWIKAYEAVVDSYLGQVPQNFNYKGKNGKTMADADAHIYSIPPLILVPESANKI